MQVLLGLVLFSVLLTTGASLQCETCESQKSTCSGFARTCAANETNCFAAAYEASVGGITTQVSMKSCRSTNACTDYPTFLNFGDHGFVRGATFCCWQSPCRSNLPWLPTRNAKRNGYKCPLCVTTLNKCSERLVHCAGFEDTCIDLVTRTNTGGSTVETIMRGCSSKTVCNSLQPGQRTFIFTDSEILKVNCTPANTASPLSGWPLTALSGVLLMKIVF